MSYPILPDIHLGFKTVLLAAQIRCREYEPNADLNPPEVLVQAGTPRQLTYGLEGVHQTDFDLIYVVGANKEPRAQQIVLGEGVRRLRNALFGSDLDGAVQGLWLDAFEPDDEIRFREDEVTGWFGGFQRVRVMT